MIRFRLYSLETVSVSLLSVRLYKEAPQLVHILNRWLVLLLDMHQRCVAIYSSFSKYNLPTYWHHLFVVVKSYKVGISHILVACQWDRFWWEMMGSFLQEVSVWKLMKMLLRFLKPSTNYKLGLAISSHTRLFILNWKLGLFYTHLTVKWFASHI